MGAQNGGDESDDSSPALPEVFSDHPQSRIAEQALKATEHPSSDGVDLAIELALQSLAESRASNSSMAPPGSDQQQEQALEDARERLDSWSDGISSIDDTGPQHDEGFDPLRVGHHPSPHSGPEAPSDILKSWANREGVEWTDRQERQAKALGNGPLAEELSSVLLAFLAFEDLAEENFASHESLDEVPAQEELPQKATHAHGSDSVLDDLPVLIEPSEQTALLKARTEVLRATTELAQALEGEDRPQNPDPCEPLQLPPLVSIDLAGCDNHYPRDFRLLVDVGGDDIYQNNAGGTGIDLDTCETLQPRETTPAAALIDLGPGDDIVGDPSDPRGCGANGGAVFGMGLLLNEKGDTRYHGAERGVNGGGSYGLGALIDFSGNDTYRAGDWGTNGGGVSGTRADGSLLVDMGGDDRYSAGDKGTNGGGVYGGAGQLLDAEGDDRYEAGTRGANGGAYYKARGLLVDRSGSDRFDAEGCGVNGGGCSEGVGSLISGRGDDTYTGGNQAVNGGGFAGAGLLVDGGGDDAYRSGGQGTNGGASFVGVGTLLDVSGDDRYLAGDLATNGGTGDYLESGGSGGLVDLAGDDHYEAGVWGTNGGSLNFGQGLLVDGDGRDRYRDRIVNCEDCSYVPKGYEGTQADSDDGSPRNSVEEQCESPLHPPIRITEDEGLEGFVWTNPLTGETEPRPGSGIRGGTGTAEDPYVISRWCITASSPEEPTPLSLLQGVDSTAVLLEETNAHVVIKNITVIGPFTNGVHLGQATNATVQNNHFWRTSRAVFVDQSPLTRVTENRITLHGGSGVSVQTSPGTVVDHNTIHYGNGNGIVTLSPDVLVAGNHVFHSAASGMYAIEGAVTVNQNSFEENRLAGAIVGERASQTSVEGNELRGNDQGIKLRGSQATVMGNTIQNNDNQGIEISDGEDVFVASNEVSHNNGSGILLEGDDVSNLQAPSLQANHIHDNDVGLVIKGGVKDPGIHHNDIHANRGGVGLDAQRADHPVDATENWWGCPDGPDDQACDNVLGDVVTEPWLSSPHGVGGAS